MRSEWGGIWIVENGLQSAARCPERTNPDNVPATVTVGMHLLKVGDVDVTGAWVIIMLFEASNASGHAYNMGSALRARHPEARHRR